MNFDDYMNPKNKIGSIMNNKPSAAQGPKISSARRFTRALTQERSLPKAPPGSFKKITGNLRPLAGRLGFYGGAASLGASLMDQNNRSVEDIQRRGGFVASTLKDAFPTISRVGTAIGEGLGKLVHGPIPQLPLDLVSESGSSKTQQKATQSAQTNVGNLPVQPNTPNTENVPVQPRYFYINGKKREIKGQSMPNTAQPIQPAQQVQLPQIRDYVNTESPEYNSPVVKATSQLNIPRFDPSTDSYGDILGKTLQMVNAGASLIPARAKQAELATRQNRLEADRNFKLDGLALDQSAAFRTAELDTEYQKLADRRKRETLNQLSQVANQQSPKAISYADQLKEQEALQQLSPLMFPGAPEGFINMAPSIVQQGFPLQDVQNAYYSVVDKMTKAYDTEVKDLDPNLLIQEVMKSLGAYK